MALNWRFITVVKVTFTKLSELLCDTLPKIFEIFLSSHAVSMVKKEG